MVFTDYEMGKSVTPRPKRHDVYKLPDLIDTPVSALSELVNRHRSLDNLYPVGYNKVWMNKG